jgi:hypothetical protein
LPFRRLRLYTRLPPVETSGQVFSPRRSHRLPAALFRVLKACRRGIQNQLFQTTLRSWRIAESFSWVPQPRLSRRKRQSIDPPQHTGKQPPRSRQPQPVIAGVFHQPSAPPSRWSSGSVRAPLIVPASIRGRQAVQSSRLLRSARHHSGEPESNFDELGRSCPWQTEGLALSLDASDTAARTTGQGVWGRVQLADLVRAQSQSVHAKKRKSEVMPPVTPRFWTCEKNSLRPRCCWRRTSVRRPCMAMRCAEPLWPHRFASRC